MELKINNKLFVGRYDSDDKLYISLDNDVDKIFFYKWQHRGGEKINYTENVEFKKAVERGILKNCFPILSKNEDWVVLNYDSIEFTH